MAAHNLTATLERVRVILEQTCEQDGQGHSLQESARRKAYRAGINRALDEIRAVKVPQPPAARKRPSVGADHR